LEKLKPQAGAETKDTLASFEKKMNTILEEPAGGSSASSPEEEATLERVNGDAGVVYQQIWQADAEPTSSQMTAFAAVEHDSTECLARWKTFTVSDLPALNSALRDAKAPEIHMDSTPQDNGMGSVDEE
jgi:hypothetical protein